MLIEFKCRSVHAREFTAGQKTVENQNWATGPPGRQAAGPLVLRDAGQWAAGRWAFGLPGCGAVAGPWAAGLLLAKLTVGHTKKAVIPTPGLFIERKYAAVSFNNLCRK